MTPDNPELPVPEPAPHFKTTYADLLIVIVIALSTAAVYRHVATYDFLGYDDSAYAYENTHLPEGFTAGNLHWIFLSFQPDNWFPLTRLSMLLDYRLFGLNAPAYHAETIVLHIVAALLLFCFLRGATRSRWPSAFVALVFALHPLHVESVAWVAERKDVLCAVFWFSALWAWVRYTQRPGAGRYAAALVLFALGLMSKPMIVTLPFLLPLLDLWPLRRPFSRKIAREKIPFVALSGAVIGITLLAQRGAIQSLTVLPVSLRLENSLTTVAIYISQTFWPARLWTPYAYPEFIPVWQAVAAATGIAVVSYLAFRRVRAWPWLATGWFWFLGTLIPVIGLVQVGEQARADRYMYVPMVGLSLIVAWAGDEVARHWSGMRPVLAVLAVAICASLAVRASLQTKYWENTFALFGHAVDMDSQNYLAWHNLGETFAGDPNYSQEVISYFRRATSIRPDYAPSHNNLGIIHARARRYDEAIEEYQAAIAVDPGYAGAHYNLGVTLARMGRHADAIAEFETSLRIDPTLARAHTELGAQLWTMPGHAAEGIAHFERAVRLDPDFALAHYDLGAALLNDPRRAKESLQQFREALRADPDYASAHDGIATFLLRFGGNKSEALSHLNAAQAIQADPARQKQIDLLEQQSSSVPQSPPMPK